MKTFFSKLFSRKSTVCCLSGGVAVLAGFVGFSCLTANNSKTLSRPIGFVRKKPKFTELALYYHYIPIEDLNIDQLTSDYGSPAFMKQVNGGLGSKFSFKVSPYFILEVTVDPASNKILDYVILLT